MYNHSRWSLQTARDYLPLEGLSMYEIYNTGCDTDKMDGYSDFGFEEMLLSGKYLFPTATDDNHNARNDFTSPYNDSFGSFTMLCMDRLDYKTAIEALEKGIFTPPRDLKYMSFRLKTTPCISNVPPARW